MNEGRVSKLFLGLALLAIAGLIAASLLAGVPEKLPSIALGAAWLLHVERVVAGAIAISVVIAIALRSAYGQLPLKLGATSIEFESLKASAEDSLDNLEVELKALRDRIEKLESTS
jgi:hypothetical protein